MSFFQSDFDYLRTKTQFNTFIDETNTHQHSTQYNNMMAEKEEEKKSTVRYHICKIILNHFNNNDKDNFDVSNSNLTIYVGHLNITEINSLVGILEGKGYTVILKNNNTRMTISSQ